MESDVRFVALLVLALGLGGAAVGDGGGCRECTGCLKFGNDPFCGNGILPDTLGHFQFAGDHKSYKSVGEVHKVFGTESDT